MALIYKPSGAALEYAPRALNLYQGCIHACFYCFAPAAIRKERTAFHSNPIPREAVVKALASGGLKREAQIHAASSRRDEPILLCFTCDPYQPSEEEHRLTRKVLEVLVNAGCRVAILTKGGPLAQRDFDLLSQEPHRHWFGVTLTGAGQDMEPGAASPRQRGENLLLARDHGLRTWISFEPVIRPNAVVAMIHGAARERIDHMAVGRWNHDKQAGAIDWSTFRAEAIAALTADGYQESPVNLPDGLNRTFYIKQALKEAS